jgi:VanZ family protein
MNSRFNGYIRYVLPAVAYCAFIFFISSLPSPPAPDYGIQLSDKVNHAGAYGIMMLLAFRASKWLVRNRTIRWQLLLALLFCLLYGASDEIHQYFVPNRECNFFDWLADATGALLGGAFILLTQRFRIASILFGPKVASSESTK